MTKEDKTKENINPEEVDVKKTDIDKISTNEINTEEMNTKSINLESQISQTPSSEEKQNSAEKVADWLQEYENEQKAETTEENKEYKQKDHIKEEEEEEEETALERTEDITDKAAEQKKQEPQTDSGSTHNAIRDDSPENLGTKIFKGFSFIPLLSLICIFVLYNITLFWAKIPLQLNELNQVAAACTLAQGGSWLLPSLNGFIIPNIYPLFTFLLFYLIKITTISEPFAIHSFTFISSLVFLCSTYILSKIITKNKKQALAASLIVFSSLAIFGLSWHSQPEILGMAFATLSFIFFFLNLEKKSSVWFLYLSSFFGFFFAACACLVSGFWLGLFILLSLIIFLILSGQIKKNLQKDFVYGLTIFILLLGGWFTTTLISLGSSQLKEFFSFGSVWGFNYSEFTDLTLYAKLYFIIFCLSPWIFLPIFLPWFRLNKIFSKTFITSFKNPEQAGSLFIWSIFFAGLLLLIITNFGSPLLLLSLLLPVAVLAGQGLLNLSGLRIKLFTYFTAAYVFILAYIVWLIFVKHSENSFYCFPTMPWQIPTLAWLIPALTFILLGLLILWQSKKGSGQSLLLAFLLTILLGSQALWHLTIPEVDSYLRLNTLRSTLLEKINDGYQPVIYDFSPTQLYPVPTGLFFAKTWEEVLTLIKPEQNEAKNIALILPLSTWQNHKQELSLFTEIKTQYLVTKQFILLTSNKVTELVKTPDHIENMTNSTELKQNNENLPELQPQKE